MTGRHTRPSRTRSISRGCSTERAGVSVEELSRLVELGILTPDGGGRFSEGDVRRVGLVQSLAAAAIPVELLAAALQSGELTLEFMDARAYSLFLSLTGETFRELSARTGPALASGGPGRNRPG